MAITHFVSRQIGPMTFEYRALSDLPTPTFYWWRDGEPYGSTTVGVLVVTLSIGGSVRIDVFDSESDTPGIDGYPSYLTITWPSITGAIRYIVERYTGSEWQNVGSMLPVAGLEFYEYVTDQLDDEQLHTYRVSAISASNERGRVREVSVTMCRYPAAVPFTVAHDALSGVPTVTRI